MDPAFLLSGIPLLYSFKAEECGRPRPAAAAAAGITSLDKLASPLT
jgi:hypothetical protein